MPVLQYCGYVLMIKRRECGVIGGARLIICILSPILMVSVRKEGFKGFLIKCKWRSISLILQLNKGVWLVK